MLLFSDNPNPKVKNHGMGDAKSFAIVDPQQNQTSSSCSPTSPPTLLSSTLNRGRTMDNVGVASLFRLLKCNSNCCRRPWGVDYGVTMQGKVMEDDLWVGGFFVS